jgi:PKD repeat protein
VTPVNDEPVITDIPNQSINEGSSFTSITLDNYISDIEDADTAISWLSSGQSEISITITDRVAHISISDSDWNGNETITFTATDTGGLTATDTVVLTVTAVNDAPVITDISDQTISEGASFATITLDDFISDVDHTDDQISWTATGQTELSVSFNNRVATISIPDTDWYGAETIMFTATDPGNLSASNSATFTVTSVNDAPESSDIPDQTIQEDSSFATIQLDNYVSDPDNTDNELSWTATGQNELTVTINNREATITIPDAEWKGNETITFIVTDPDGLTDSDSAIFTVTEVNDPPVISNIPDQTIAEGAAFTDIQLDNYVSDPDNTDTEITWTATGQSDLTITIENRIASITLPDENWNGTETITFKASDPEGLTAIDSVMLTVTAVNDAPIVSDITNQTIAEGSSFATISLDNFVSDIDNQNSEISWSGTGQTDLNVSINNRIATITTPDENWNGTETIIFTATDIAGLTDTDSATFTVTSVNDAPTITDIPNQTINEGSSFSSITLDDFISDIEDADNVISWIATGQSDLTITITNRVAQITMPDNDWNGSETITFTATDSGGLTATDTVVLTVNPVNDAPVISNISDQTIAEGASFATITLDNYISDVDNTDDQISWTATGQSELSVSFNNRVATISIPDTDWYGTETIVFTATDPGDLSASNSATFTVTPVNDAPMVSDIPDQNILEGQAFSSISLNLYVNDKEDSDNDITWSVSGESALTVSINNQMAAIDTPDTDWNGSEIIVFTAMDSGNLTGSVSVVFHVTPVNDPPAFSIGSDITINEDAGLVSYSAWATNIDSGATNEVDQQLTFSLTPDHSELFAQLPEIDPFTGKLTFRSEKNIFGTTNVIVTLQDDAGRSNGGNNVSSNQSFTITIQPVNDPPSFTLGDNLAIKQNTVISIENWATQIISGPANESDDVLTFFLDASPSDLFEQQPSIDNTGRLSLKTAASKTGTSLVSVFLADNSGGDYTSGTKTFTVEVTASSPPEISGLSDQHINQDSTFGPSSFSVTDLETADEAIMVSATSSNTALVRNADIQISTDGSYRHLTIIPVSGQYGTTDISVSANDGSTTTIEQILLTVHPKPSANIGVASDQFGYTKGTAPLSVHFVPVDIQHEEEITGWLWEFSDGGTRDIAEPVYTFLLDDDQNPSFYSVSLTVYGYSNATFTTSQTNLVQVEKKKDIRFTADITYGESPLNVHFSNQCTGFSDTPVYTWYFGDGEQSNDINAEHIYSEPGIYTVTLAAFDGTLTRTYQISNYIKVKGRTIQGYVKAEDTQTPLNGCIVEVWHNTSGLLASGTTDISGNYLITNLPAKDNLVVVAWPPFELKNIYAHRYFENADFIKNATQLSTLNTSLQNKDILLPASPDIGIRGRVLSAINPQIGISSIDVQVFSEQLGSGDITTTDEDGYYTLTGLKPANDYIVSAWSVTYNTEFFYSKTSDVTPETFVSISQADHIEITSTYINDVNIYVVFTECISGHVTADGRNISNIWVTAIDEDLEWFNGALTDISGNYTICGLIAEKQNNPVKYKAYISSSKYPFIAYNQISNFENASWIEAGQTNIDFQLQTGADISGVIIANNGEELAGVKITASSVLKDTIGTTISDAYGNFTISNLPLSNDYILKAEAVDYPTGYYNNARTQASATPVNIHKGNITDLVFILNKRGVIRGYVKLNDGIQSAGAGHWVNIWSPTTQIANNCATDAQGMYEIIGLDENINDYIISVKDNNEYMPAYYNSNGTVYNSDEAEQVSPSESVFRNIILSTGYSISGEVTDKNGNLLHDILVSAVSIGSKGWGYVLSRNKLTDGYNYKIDGLPPGIYDLCADSDDYLKQCKTITLTSNSQHSAHFELSSNVRRLSGNIYGLKSGQQIVLWAHSNSSNVIKNKTITGNNSDIAYDIDGLPAVSDFMVELISSDVAYQVYNQKKNVNNADLIDLSSQDQTNIDFHVATANITLSGSITFESDIYQDAWVDVSDSQKNFIKGIHIRYRGINPVEFQVSDLDKDMYIVSVWPSKCKPQYYQNAETIDDARLINATENSVNNINFTIIEGEQINGHIYLPDGQPAKDIDILVSNKNAHFWASTKTDTNGYYVVNGLDENNDYIVEARRDKFPPLYYHEDGAVLALAQAQPVSVNTSNVNITYYTHTSVSGTVKNIHGYPLSGIRIIAESTDLKLFHACYTLNDGSYVIEGLPTDSVYIIKAVPSNTSIYRPQLILDIVAPDNSVNFVLSEGYSINGVVTSASQGTPVNKAWVCLSSINNDIFKRVKTNSKGEYTLKGLPSGNDYAMVITPDETSGYASWQMNQISVNSDLIQNIELEYGLSITGHIIQTSDQAPIPNILVTAFSQNQNFISSGISDSDGAYSITNLPYATDYVVTARPENFAEQTLKDQIAGSIVDFSLDQGGIISGYVYTSNGSIKGASVSACSNMLQVCESSSTDETGYYEISGLKQYWNGITVDDYVVTAYAIGYPDHSVGQKEVGDTVNFTLTSNDLTGTIRDSSGALLPQDGITVWIKVYKNGSYLTKAKAQKDGSGQFTVKGLESNTGYQLKIKASGFDQEWVSPGGTGVINIENAGEFMTGDIISFRFASGVW